MEPNENNVPTMPEQKDANGKSVGPAIGIIVIVALLILGGLYFWGQKADQSEYDENLDTQEESEMIIETETEIIPVVEDINLEETVE